MVDAIRIAQCILNEMGSLTTMKLQKLVFYSQAYHLVNYEEPLFNDKIEAWANGPVVSSLFQAHKGRFVVQRGDLGDASLSDLTPYEQNTLLRVINCLGAYSGSALSELTHNEAPWKDMRKGLDPRERSSRTISCESIRLYYGSAQCKNPLFA